MDNKTLIDRLRKHAQIAGATGRPHCNLLIEAADCIEGLLSAQPQASVPDGWRLVPVNPNVSMIQGAAQHITNGDDPDEPRDRHEVIGRIHAIWTDMLAAAPSAQSPAQAAPQQEQSYEHRRAIMEGERNAAADGYFKARREGLDTIHNRRIFEAGFERGYSAASVAAQPQGWDAEFLSKRLARVAKLAGVPMPDFSHEQIAEAAGTILGEIAGELERAAQPQEARELPPLPEPWIRDMDAPAGSQDHFAADQMQEYARTAQAAPALSQELIELLQSGDLKPILLRAGEEAMRLTLYRARQAMRHAPTAPAELADQKGGAA